MALKFKFALFFLIGIFVFFGAADVSFADSNCYWGCNSSELRCQGVDSNNERSNCDWVCTNTTLICVDSEHGSAICNLEVGCPNPVYQCIGPVDQNGERTNCDWYCPSSGPNCDNGSGGGGGGNCIPDGGSCVGQPGSACCSGICDVRDREGEERADVCVGREAPTPTPTPTPPPSVDIKADNSNGPVSIAWNSSSNLSWTSANVSSCDASGDWSGSKGTSGSQSTSNLALVKTYNYTLTCTGPGGSANDAVNVVVFAPVPNNPSNVSVTEPNYCASGPAATTEWTYSDQSGSPQSAYQVQIDDQGSFNSPEWDSGKVACSGCRSNATPQGYLAFNKNYRVRVRVWNQYDAVSGWTESSVWQTPQHAYPQTDFSFAGAIPGQQNLIPDSPIQFTDQSTCYNSQQNQVVCNSWLWNFNDSTTSTQRNTQHTYSQTGTYNVNLRATDSDGTNCSITKPVQVIEFNPIWIEINPGG